MSHTQSAVHVRTSDRKGFVAAINEHYESLGFEPVEEPDLSEPELLRARIDVQGAWLSLTDEQMDKSADAWATHLSRALKSDALAVSAWESLGKLTATLFDKGKKAGALALPENASRVAGDKNGKVAIALGDLSRLVGKGEAATGLSVRFTPVDPDPEGELSISLEDALPALSRAFGVKDVFPDPLDEEGGGFLLAFRPKGARASGAKKKSAGANAPAPEDPQRRLDHDARVYGVGWLAFDATPRDYPKLLERIALPLVELFVPLTNAKPWQIHRISRGHKHAALINWTDVPGALAKGDYVEISQPVTTVIASLSIIARDESLSVTWSLRALKDDTKRRAISASMDAVVHEACADSRCFGALLSAQAEPVNLDNQALAFEYLRARSIVALRTPWLRTHARSPGWRALIPKAATAKPKGELANNWTSVQTAAGTLLKSGDPDPYAVLPKALDQLEAHLAPCLGDAKSLVETRES